MGLFLILTENSQPNFGGKNQNTTTNAPVACMSFINGLYIYCYSFCFEFFLNVLPKP